MIASNLMVGDLIQYNGEILRLYEFSRKYGYFGEGHPLNGILISEIEPIPLTPEILEKNGFAERFDDDLVLMECEGIVMEIGNNYTRFKDGKMFLHRVLTPLYYVHELQHALKLCGIEKEIVA